MRAHFKAMSAAWSSEKPNHRKHLVSFISISLRSFDTIWPCSFNGPLQSGYSVWRRASIDWNQVDGTCDFVDRQVRGILMKWSVFVIALSVAGGTAALAADIPPPLAPPPYIPVAPPYPYNWSGFYIGGNLGAGFTNTGTATDTFSSTFGTTTNTLFLGGGQVGVNYEFWSFFVIGAEAMFDWLPNTQNTVNVTNTTLVPGTTNTAAVTLNNRWVTMVTGKLGYAWDRVLLYGKGGGAWVGTSSPGLTVNNAPASFTSTSNNNNFGATVGLGIEWAFAGNWSARAEWDAILLQNQSFAVSGSAFSTDTITVNNRSINMFTAALSYKFGGWW
jgi:outer membrane immunogenic protein